MWADLHERTDGLRGPLLFSPPSSLPVTFHEIASILRGARDAPGSTKLNYFRAYVEGREDYDLARQFLESEDLGAAGIEATLARAFDPDLGPYGKRAGLIVNGGLQWSHEVHERLVPHAEALGAVEAGTVTIDITLFIGSYGATPFGAHIDDSTHRTIIFNLGPGIKDVDIWPRECVEAQFGPVRNIIDTGTICIAPAHFSIAPGEAFVLPSNEFHIAYNNAVSTAATLVLDHPSDVHLAERELTFLRHDLYDDMPNGKTWQLTLARLAELGRLRSRSNGCLRYPPPPRAVSMQYLQRRSVIRIDPRWPVLAEAIGSAAVVYARGRHILANGVSRAVVMLVEAERATVEDFLEAVVSEGGNLTTGLQVVEFLLGAGGANVE
ncbi:MAG TPA: hypothetical protein VNZ61_14065 [Roseomonas sp.]|nr:hypothetical protein [Roseomonas sp.]